MGLNIQRQSSLVPVIALSNRPNKMKWLALMGYYICAEPAYYAEELNWFEKKRFGEVQLRRPTLWRHGNNSIFCLSIYYLCHWYGYIETSQWTHNVEATSDQQHCDVITLDRRYIIALAMMQRWIIYVLFPLVNLPNLQIFSPVPGSQLKCPAVSSSDSRQYTEHSDP